MNRWKGKREKPSMSFHFFDFSHLESNEYFSSPKTNALKVLFLFFCKLCCLSVQLQVCLSMCDLLLPPGIKGLKGYNSVFSNRKRFSFGWNMFLSIWKHLFFCCVKYLSWKRFIWNNYTMKIKREFAYLMQNYLMTKLLLSITS